MPTARKHQIALGETPYYHVISRCVRRAFLCGFDHYSNKSYGHRRGWVRARLASLVNCFAVDLYAYAVMSNHYHLVVRVNEREAEQWSHREIVQRWLGVFSGPEIAKRFMNGETLSPSEEDDLFKLIDTWRSRLCDLSWFMRVLNEGIAREANAEDCCKGRFWEGRFKCQALLNEQALLTCMAYVDLNPIRADMAQVPEESDYTSAQQRAAQLVVDEDLNSGVLKLDADKPRDVVPAVLPPLVPLADKVQTQPVPTNDAAVMQTLRVSTEEYLELVDAAGRSIRQGKRGAIPEHCLPIMERIHLKPARWLQSLQRTLHFFPKAMGTKADGLRYAQVIGQQWIWQVEK